MIKYGLILAIIILIIVFRQRIKDAVLGVILVGALAFLAIFLVDSQTQFPLRTFFNMEKFDDITANPQENLTEVVDKVVDSGKGVASTINKRGDELDAKYGTGIGENKEDTEEDSKEENYAEGNDYDEDTAEENPSLNLELGQYLYKSIEADLSNALSGLSNKEKAIVRSLSPLITLEHETDNVIIRSIKGENYYEVESK